MILVCFLLLLTVVSYLRYWRGRGMKDFYSSEPMLFSHRGVTSDYPENTLEAYKESEKRGFNGIELDIISSRDGVLYCSHNHQLEQETDSSGYIHQTISTKLDKIKTGIFSHPNNQKNIPRIENVFNNMSNNIRLNIEIKFSGLFDFSTISALKTFLKKNKVRQKILISSFNPLIVFYSRWLIPHVKTGFLFENMNMLKWMNFCHPDCIHPRADFLKKELVSICKKKNVFINTWTVNSESSIDFCKKLRVSGIITDISNAINE